MKINKISTKLVKPETPTPQNLKNYNISFLDNSLTPMNLAILLFYQSKPTHLEESLSKILVQFYPLAGRYIKSERSVDCSDQGAEFIEAEAQDIELIDLVGKMELEKLNTLYPDQYFRVDEDASDPLVSIQATAFPCGGLVIAISVTHRVFDIPSITTLITAWSEAANPHKVVQVAPCFPLPTMLPLRDDNFGVNLKGSTAGASNIVGKRLVFDEAALTSLRSKLRTGDRETVSGSCVVSAVIIKVLIGLDRVKQGKNRDFVVFQPINMRERTIPPQGKHVCGNLTFTSLAQGVAAPGDVDVSVQELVDLINDGVGKSAADLSGVLSPDRDGRDIIMDSLGSLMKAVQNRETNFISFSDCSEFGFYEADFGSGKPVWASIIPQRLRSNAAVLMGSREGDGIEAWVYLDKDDMPYFEQHQEIKLFAF